MAYATLPDLAKLLGYPDGVFPAGEEPRAQLLLDLASGEIDAEIEQSLLDGVEDRTLDGTGSEHLLLPRWPVTDVISVAEVDPDTGAETTLTYRADYTWSGDGILTRKGAATTGNRCGWPAGQKSVHVVFHAGFATISDDVRRICLAMAVRGSTNPSGAAEERLGDHTIKWSAAALGMELSPSEKTRLAKYTAKTAP